MAKADDLIPLDDDEQIEAEENNYEISSDARTITARRKLEEYMEMKKLRELTEF